MPTVQRLDSNKGTAWLEKRSLGRGERNGVGDGVRSTGMREAVKGPAGYECSLISIRKCC